MQLTFPKFFLVILGMGLSTLTLNIAAMYKAYEPYLDYKNIKIEEPTIKHDGDLVTTTYEAVTGEGTHIKATQFKRPGYERYVAKITTPKGSVFDLIHEEEASPIFWDLVQTRQGKPPVKRQIPEKEVARLLKLEEDLQEMHKILLGLK